jgi:hypothetical protein
MALRLAAVESLEAVPLELAGVKAANQRLTLSAHEALSPSPLSSTPTSVQRV